MGFKCGIIGLPNVGKSTVFNAVTQAQVAAANYPFCTIDPNVGVVPVPDPRLQALAALVQPQATIPAVMEFVDIAGLVKGAAQGEGLGNKFLANIRETQAIAHVVRCFTNPDVIHVAGKINPLDDIEIIDTELILADLETVEKAWHKVSKIAKSGNKEACAEQGVLAELKRLLEAGKPARLCTLPEQPLWCKQLLTAKPVLYIANVDEQGLVNNPYLAQVQAKAAAENAVVVPICATLEAEIAQLTPEDKLVFLADLGLQESGLDRVIHAGYTLLGLQTFFTAGPKEVKAWTISQGMKAPQAAGVIHTDFARGFICVEVIAFDDYVACQGEAKARECGKLRLEGKNYIMQDGDVVHFRFNV